MTVRTTLLAGAASAALLFPALSAIPGQAAPGGPQDQVQSSRQAAALLMSQEGKPTGVLSSRADRRWRLPGRKSSARARAAARAIARGPLSDGRRPGARMPREPYLPQVGCYPKELPGLAAFRSMLLQTFPRSDRSLQVYNVVRGCNESGISEHEEGRALDFEARVWNRKQRAQARFLLRWLTKRKGYHAKRFGIMYIIYDHHIWGTYKPYWRRLSDRGNPTANHEDHIHFSFGWNGALKRSAYWTGQAPRPHYGPCPVYRWHYAPVLVNHLTENPRRGWCGSPKPIPDSWNYSASVMFWQAGARVRWLQQFLTEAGTFHVPVSGAFGAITYQAVRDWQVANGVPPTGVWDPASQHASDRVVGRRVGTSLEGWTTAAASGATGQVLPVPVIVHTGRGVSARTVTLQRRPASSDEWQTVTTARTASDGSYTAKVPILAGEHVYRLTVPQTSTAKGLRTAGRLVTGSVAPAN